MVTRRSSGQGAGGSFAQGLSTSDTSTSGAKYWDVHTQTVYAMYERHNRYNGDLSSGTIPTPSVVQNTLELNIKVNTIDEVVYADFSGGSFNQYQQLTLTNNSPSGGFGSSGILDTSTVGIMRRPSTLVNGSPVNNGGICTKQFNYSCDLTPGPYDITDIYDTSTGVQPILYTIMQQAKSYCSTFETFLVNI